MMFLESFTLSMRSLRLAQFASVVLLTGSGCGGSDSPSEESVSEDTEHSSAATETESSETNDSTSATEQSSVDSDESDATESEQSSSEQSSSEQSSSDASTQTPSFGTEDDLERAAELWDVMDDYREWDLFPGTDGIQEGGVPHGAYVRIFVDETAVKDTDDFEVGSVILKENFMEDDEKTLAAITVMQKVKDFDATHADWFWVKYAPDGTVAENDGGVALAGKVPGCQGCHKNAGEDDFVWVNDESG